ncbi:hypothetical protein OEB99_15270 [Actinotalea sp. M2MS4P-6]|uniref:SLAC1 family transporter n=1 Tax=Actinotalea sp. M2MS4P-6 TaxID=2983762 RepID=UPI0021E4AA7F|nr:hypothetical protein [Actinotalea sp. M2MS4P-6]MCV2395674.1 hypothetical protein [Actinotalea sp. M2MS4P-6]
MSEHVDIERPSGSVEPSPALAASRLRDLHPGWLAAAMGTAILAVATDANPGGVAGLAPAAHAVGAVLAVAAYAIGAMLLIAYAARWVRHTPAALADLRHPVLGGLHATLPGAILVLAVMTAALGERLMPAGTVTAVVAVLAVVGTTLALVFGVAFGYSLFTGDAPAGAVNGGWFIPPVVTVIVPMALTPLMTHVSPGAAPLLLFIGYACLGLGFMLFLLVLGMLHDRLVLHPLPPAQLAPSLWIALGPIGVSALVPMNLARAGQMVFGDNAGAVITVSQIFATAIWGFGLWWLAIVVALLVRYLRTGPVPFHIGWWGFVFPLGAFTVATITLARVWQLPAVDGFGALLYLGLVAAWVVAATRTVASIRSGQVWRR